ncbi:hypothetical protein ACFQ2B_31105 [Streptomyces stramineus]
MLQPLTMDFTSRSDRSGGLVAPSMVVAGLSRLTGPIAAARVPTPSRRSRTAGSGRRTSSRHWAPSCSASSRSRK